MPTYAHTFDIGFSRIRISCSDNCVWISHEDLEDPDETGEVIIPVGVIEEFMASLSIANRVAFVNQAEQNAKDAEEDRRRQAKSEAVA